MLLGKDHVLAEYEPHPCCMAHMVFTFLSDVGMPT